MKRWPLNNVKLLSISYRDFRRHYYKSNIFCGFLIHLESLMRIVYTVWNMGRLDGIISEVCWRLEQVLTLINEGRGGNDKVEDKRGVKCEDMKFDFNLNSTHINEANWITDNLCCHWRRWRWSWDIFLGV